MKSRYIWRFTTAQYYQENGYSDKITIGLLQITNSILTPCGAISFREVLSRVNNGV
jgi:hypothetical protein